MAAQCIVAEQLMLIQNDVYPREEESSGPAQPSFRAWRPEVHTRYPPRFRALVRAVFLCALRPTCLLSKLPPELMLHLIHAIEQGVYWHDSRPSMRWTSVAHAKRYDQLHRLHRRQDDANLVPWPK